MDKSRRPYWYYGRLAIILIASGGFLLLSLYLRNLTEHNVFPIFFPAVALSAWVGGRLGGFLSTIALTFGAAYFHMPPAGIAVGDTADLIRLATFTLSGAFVAWLSGALKESRGIMMATLNAIGDGVIATDRRGMVRFLNPVAETLTGWTEKRAKGRPLKHVFHAVAAGTGEAIDLPAPEKLSGATGLPDNIHLVSPEGAITPIDDSLAPVQGDSGRTMGSILVFRDATRRIQSEAAAVESERQRMQAQRMEAVGRLAGGVAHDFNNLLTIINGHAELALKNSATGGAVRESIEEIRKAGERAASLTRQLLVFSRGQSVMQKVIDLNQVVANFEKMLRRLIGEDIELITDLWPEPLMVCTDIGQIEQVIMNLAVNAREAMPVGGKLTLRTEARTGGECGEGSTCAVLAVKDTGIGIDPKSKPHLFEPFFTTKEVGQGSGLGLSIIYGIVKSCKGRIRVESELGKGSAFEVYLPRVLAIADEPDVGPPAHETGGAPGTILLVEDDSEVRTLMREVLKSAGYRVLEAIKAEDALAIIEDYSDRIDLMITDIVMPGMGGFELAARMKSLRPQTPVLYVSGYPDRDEKARSLSAERVDYLPKPFGPAELTSKVAELVGRSRSSGSH